VDALITAVGLTTPLGFGREAFVRAWRDGAVAERVAEGPEAGGVRLGGKLALRSMFPEHRASLRRMDRLSKIIAMSAGLARAERGGFDEGSAVAIGTDLGTLEGTWAFLTRLRDKGPALANPNEFPNLVPNAGAGYVGLFCGLRGPSQTFCQHETCGDDAVAWAAHAVAEGRVPAALAGGAEELGPIRALATDAGGCLPDGGAAGEGGAMVVLERSEAGLARVLATRGACAPPKSPFRRESGAEALPGLIRRTLDAAGVAAGDVGAVLLSDAGADLSDAVDAVLGPGVPRTDHAARLGQHPADGAFRIALAALLLADRSLPVHLDGDGCRGSAALVLSAARGGSLRATVLGAC
jgi:3-oxoacyl-[acyl-carrier-protein] synthase II